MYASFFGLRELPFNNTPDPRFFYPTQDHEEALASLIYAAQERKGFVLLTGEAGAGKTLVSRMMLRHFGTRVAFATINHALGSGGDLLESICIEFELPLDPQATHTQLVRALHDFLLGKFAQDVPVILVLDEAQTLPVDAFEQVRMIGNLEADDAKLLQVAIFGQPELQSMFASPSLRQLRQRIFRSFHLSAMSREETQGYINHRLSVAGADEQGLFDQDAIARVYEFSRGLPRVINTLCDNAMLSAYSVGQREMGGRFIESVARQMMAFGDSAPKEYEFSGGVSAGARHRSARTLHTPDATHEHASGQSDAGERFAHRPAHHAPRVLDHGDGGQGSLPAGPAKATGRKSSHSRHSMDAFKDEMVLLARDLRSRVEQVNRRLTSVEGQLAETSGLLSKTQAAQDSLGTLTVQARSLVQQSKGNIAQLAEREARVQELSVKMRRVIDEVRHIFGGLKRATASTQQAERGARQVYEGLSAQTERSQRIADKLGHVVERLAREMAAQQSLPVKIIKESSTPVAGPGRLVATDVPQPPTHVRLRKLLRSSRESLSDLRTVVQGGSGDREGHSDLRNTSRTGDGPRPNTGATDEGMPTQRLAAEVDSLLALVESRTAPSL